MKRICAVIVHHKGRGLLDACLRSLLASDDVEVEVVVAANACQGEMPEIVGRDPRVEVVWIEEPVGFSRANNIGVRRSVECGHKPDFYFFLNNDTTVERDTLAKLVAAADQNSDCGIVGPRLMISGAQGILNSLGLNVTRTGEAWDEGIGIDLEEYGSLPQTEPVIAVTGAALMIRSSLFEELSGWEELYDYYYEDIDFCLRAQSRGRSVLRVTEAVVWHAISATASRDSDFKLQLTWRNRLLLMLIHWPKPLLRQVWARVCATELRQAGQRIRSRAFHDAWVQIRSWGGVGKRVIRALQLRAQVGEDTRWAELLREPVSVPVITLPAVGAAVTSSRSKRPMRSSPRILVCGMCPLPFEDTMQNYGPGIRTWQLAWSLAQAGHEVILVAMEIPGIYKAGEMVVEQELDGVLIHRLVGQEFMEPKTIEGFLARYTPDAAVGATIYGSFALARSEPEIPFWADQFGHVMAEAQAKAALEQANWPLAHWWKMVELVMRRADRVSTVSQRQAYAAIGELGAFGRLNFETCGFDFTAVIPCALIPRAATPTERVIRGIKVADDDFVVLWSGGYNVWSDVGTLFDGLELAMKRESRIHFVSTGGAIKGHDSVTYPRFQELIGGSAFAERFHLEGWVRNNLVPAYVAEADLGVLTEQPIYEGLLGSKNRIIQWMGDGLPVAYNRVGDLGDYLLEKEAGLVFQPGDAAALSQHILWASSHSQELGAMSRRAKSLARAEMSFENSTRPLLEWAKKPEFAPDVSSRASIRSPLDHGGIRDRVSAKAQEISTVRRSSTLRRLWRRLVTPERQAGN